MKPFKLYTIFLIVISSICTTNSYAKENDYDFILIEKEIQNGINKRTMYGLAKKTKAKPLVRAISFSSATSQVEIIPPIYDAIEELYGDFFAILKDKQMGLTNRDGKIIFEAKYDAISELGDNLLVLMKDNKTGIAKRDGEILLEPTCSYLPKFKGEFVLVNSYFMDSTGRSTLLNKKGEFIVDIKHNILQGGGISGVNYIDGAFYNFLQEGRWGLIDELGNIIIDPAETNYEHMYPADLMPYRDSLPKKYTLKSFILEAPVDIKNPKSIGRTIKRHNVDAISYIGNDLFLYLKNKKIGIINRKREIVEDFKYDKMSIVDKTYLLLENSKDEKDTFKMETSEALSLRYILRHVEI